VELFIKDIARLTGGKLTGYENRKVSQLLIDSRSHFIPDRTIFFALKGPNHDGHRYIHQLYERGVRCFVTSLPVPENEFTDPPTLIRVPDTLTAFQQLGAFNREQFNSPLIGICGSNGKTIVKEWLSQALSSKYKVIRSPKSYNSQTGVPLSLWLLDPSFDFGIIEAGISKPGEMKKLEQMIRPDIGIFTNIGEPHQENFKDIHQKLVEKLKLFKDARQIIYCRDHPLVHKAIQQQFAKKGREIYNWSVKGKADLEVLKKKKSGHGIQVEILFRGRAGSLVIPFIDRASFENVLHVSLALFISGFTFEEVSKVVSKLEPVAMRMELKKGIHHCTLINDTYNSDLASLGIALDFLDQQPARQKKILILSDILQSGRTETELYKQVADMVDGRNLSRFIGIGEALYRNSGLFNGSKFFFKSTDEFLNHFSRNQFHEELVLLKGARIFEFERISRQLEFQVHETQLEISMSALVNNLNFFRKKLHDKTRIMVMVKAFGYGSGAPEIAGVLQHQGVDYLAVAYTDEGIALRGEGITLPILVMSPEPRSLKSLIAYSLEPELYSFTILNRFVYQLRLDGIQNYPVHIKLDTGMHRLGFRESEVEKLQKQLIETTEIQVRSFFSHLAGSEDPLLDSFTREQIALFEKIRKRMIREFPETLFHILNSAGIERFPEAQYDMVRLGIGLHGISASHEHGLQPVAKFKSIITQIKEVPPGETIGYGRKAIAGKKMKIAVIPVGYADGMNRHLGNGNWHFFVKGKKIPLVGEICMDMCMADVTNLKVSEGTEVEVFGPHVTVREMAASLDTIPYEILTSVSGRVKRIYLSE